MRTACAHRRATHARSNARNARTVDEVPTALQQRLHVRHALDGARCEDVVVRVKEEVVPRRCGRRRPEVAASPAAGGIAATAGIAGAVAPAPLIAAVPRGRQPLRNRLRGRCAPQVGQQVAAPAFQRHVQAIPPVIAVANFITTPTATATIIATAAVATGRCRRRILRQRPGQGPQRNVVAPGRRVHATQQQVTVVSAAAAAAALAERQPRPVVQRLVRELLVVVRAAPRLVSRHPAHPHVHRLAQFSG